MIVRVDSLHVEGHEFCDSYYSDFAASVYASIREETYSVDIGQNGCCTKLVLK